MHKKLMIGLIAPVVALLAGCGGGGAGAPTNPSTLNTTRTLVGFVYVKSPANPSSSQPDVIITPASTPPQFYDVPTAGTVTLIVQSGAFLLQSAGTNNKQVFTKNVADGNDIIITVATQGSTTVTVTGSGIMAVGAPKTLNQYDENLNDGFGTGTTHNMNSPSNPETRTPNRASSSTMRFSLDGVPASNPTTSILAGQKSYLGVAVLDSQGISVPGIPTYGNLGLISSGPQITVDSSKNLIIPAFQGQLPATVTVTATVPNPSVTGEVAFDYNYGPASKVSIAKDDKGTAITTPIDLRWQVSSNPIDPNAKTTALLYATVTNKYGAAIPEVVVDWSNIKAPNNVWTTTSAGACFVNAVDGETPSAQSTTDISGVAVIMISAPVAADGPLGGTSSPPFGNPGSGDQRPKGLNHVYATVDTTTVKNADPAQFRITRDMMTIKIREKDTMSQQILDVRTNYEYHAYGTDVDKTQTDDPPGSTWTCVNTVGSKFYGNNGDDFRTNIPKGHFDTQSTSQAQMSGSTMQTGKVAGEATISLTYPGLTSDGYKVQIYGEPAKIYFPLGGPWDNPWDMAQNTWRPTPDNSLQGEIGNFTSPPEIYSDWIPDNGTPPTLHIYLYMHLMDSFGHILPHTNTIPAVSTTDPFDASAVFIDPVSPYNGTINKITPPGASFGDPCYDLHPGAPNAFWGIHFNATGTYIGWGGALSLPISVSSIVPDGKGGFLGGRRCNVHNPVM